MRGMFDEQVRARSPAPTIPASARHAGHHTANACVSQKRHTIAARRGLPRTIDAARTGWRIALRLPAA
ncbi:hypothetical protein DF160_23865 [Burkholderia anthina]|nr:hypothetical protein DF160_23865 [Burkholderia anthina]